jgi:hypothetical protein
MQIVISIPINWVNKICSQRDLVNKYQTNTLIKSIGTYLYLKNISTSGTLYDFNKQKKQFYTDLNLSKNSFDTSIQNCINIGLLTLKNNTLELSSYSNVSKLLGVFGGKKIKFVYNNENGIKIHDTLNTLNFKLCQSKQQKAILNRINANSYLKGELISYLNNNTDLTEEQILNELFKLQINFFKQGTKNSSLFAFRLDYNNTLMYLKKLFNTKSSLSITYLKRKLQKLNLLFIEKIGGITSNGKFRAREISTKLSCNYRKDLNKPIWYINDRLHLNLIVK